MNFPFSLTLRNLALTVLLGYWLLIFIGTHLPHPPQIALSGLDKVVHFLAYFGLSFLLATLVMRFHPTPASGLMVLCVVTWYGAADELTQYLVPHRHADAWDWAADVAGGIAGIASYWISLRGMRGWLRRMRSAA